MKAKKLFISLSSILLLAGCNQKQVPSIQDIANDISEFDFTNYSAENVESLLYDLQSNKGYTISFNLTYKEDVNSNEKEEVAATIGAKGKYCWVTATRNNETFGGALKIVNDTYQAMYYENNAWLAVDGVKYNNDDINSFIKEYSDYLYASEEQSNIIKNVSNRIGSTSVASRPCYTYQSTDHLVELKVDKVFGVILGLNITYIDLATSGASQLIMEITGFNVGIGVPNFPL